jgi:lipid-A-disaccharide synthase-like uncharacterized protein
MSAKGIIQLLVKSTFLGFFFGMCLGLFVGGVVVPVVFWPKSNLGPLVGAIYGLPSGAIVGTVLGLFWGLVRIWGLRRREEQRVRGLKGGL